MGTNESLRIKVGLFKFADFRPKHCVLAGASGTHSVCVCTIHQNVKLMMLGIQHSDIPTYHHCLAKTRHSLTVTWVSVLPALIL